MTSTPDAVMTAVAVAVPLLVGRWVRGQARMRIELARTAERLEARRERDARNAAEEERMRIATDLQGAVAGELRQIAARATELRARLAVGDHAAARTILTEVAETAREALADVRRALGVLRRTDRAPRLTPPGAEAGAPEPAADEPALAAPAVPRPSRRTDPVLIDRALVAVLLVVAAAELLVSTSGAERLLAALVAVALAAPLLVRRHHPLPAGAAVLVAVAAQSILLDLDGFSLCATLSIVCAAYAIGAHAERRASVGGLLAFALGAGVHAAVFHPDAVGAALLGGVAVPWAIGRIVRGNRRLTRELRDEAAQLEAGRARDARAAVTAERMRVARELHDAVAHNISVIAIQAAGADGIVERDPRRAAQCAALIEAVAGEALAELGSLAAASPAPEPGLARVGALAGRARAGGLPVDLRVEGDRGALPAGVDLAAYRIVQEALANASKHAGEAHATVVVRYAASAVEVEVADDGAGPGAPGETGDGAGHGLIGMRERVALYGGTLDVGRRPSGGFLVHARLPIGGRERPRPHRRRPVARARGLPPRAREPPRPRGRRRGLQRPRGDPQRRAAEARRRADGHPHARARRDRRDAPDHGRDARARARAHHLRPRRVRLRRAPGRRQRVPAQGHAARPARRRDPLGGRRRGAARPHGDAAADRGVRPHRARPARAAPPSSTSSPRASSRSCA